MRTYLAWLLTAAFFYPLGVTAFAAHRTLPVITVTVSVTSRQARLNYTAPDTSACTVEISESATYSPVVADVNATLFSGSNLDSRSGNLGVGTTTRVVVVGTVPLPGKIYSNLASDGKRYGRALQANTLHYYRVTCGAETGTGTFTTNNIPAGKTYPESRGVGANGIPPYPTMGSSRTTERGEKHIDSATGLQYRRLNNAQRLSQ